MNQRQTRSIADSFEPRVYELTFQISRSRFHASIRPKKMLKRPAIILIRPLISDKRRAVSAKGRPITALIKSIPPIEPIPNTAMKTMPSTTEGIVVSTKSVSAALPAMPCTIPTMKGLRPSLNNRC